MIRPVPHIGAMAPYALADIPSGLTSLAQNESAFPASPAAVDAARAALAALHLYPDPEWTDLRQVLARVHRLDPELILCGAGSMELIGCLIRAFAGPGDTVLATDYGYAFVATASAQVEADYVKARERNLTVSVDDILAAVTADTRMVFVCNPGNPTGTLLSNSELLRLRAALSEDILLVIDQAYGEFSDALPSHDPAAIFELIHESNTVALRTFSKAYGLAGARVGWGYFPAGIAVEIRKLLNPNNIACAMQAAASAAASDQGYMRQVVEKTCQTRDRFGENLRAIGLSVPESHTNFVLIRFASADAAIRADKALRTGGILMRGMGGYALPDCLRATIGVDKTMDAALHILKGLPRD